LCLSALMAHAHDFTRTTRRGAIAALAATTALPVAAALPTVADPGADPVFAAIEAHRRAWAAFDEASSARLGETVEESTERAKAAGDVLNNVGAKLTSMVPTTAASALAVLAYARELGDYDLFGSAYEGAYESLMTWAERTITALASGRTVTQPSR
jgi:hypothetical protein